MIIKNRVRSVIVITCIIIVISFIIFSSGVEDEELLDYYHPIKLISKEKVTNLKAGLTYREVLKKLGPTKDIGSGVHVAAYAVKEGGTLILPFSDYDQIIELDGRSLYKLNHK